MKQKDLALVLVTAFVGVVLALIASRLIFSSPKNSKQSAEVVDIINADFSLPSSEFFNAESVNPTQQIEIGGNNNPNPFNTNPH